MKILLIGNKETSDDPEKYYSEYKAFFDAALETGGLGGEIDFTLFDDLVISVGDGEFSIYDSRHQLELNNYQVILIRGKGFRQLFDVVKTISSYAKHNNMHVLNDYSSFRDSSKLTQATHFFEHDMPVAMTVYANAAVLNEKTPLKFGFPCIMKATFGAHGNDNYLVNNMEEARQIQSKSPNLKFVLQRFVPNNSDFRILIIGEEVFVIGRSAAAGSHLNNTSQGGEAVLVDAKTIPETIINDSFKIMKSLGMTIAGVDVLADKSTGEYFFLEVNSQPQLMSGAFVDEKIAAVGRYFHKLNSDYTNHGS